MNPARGKVIAANVKAIICPAGSCLHAAFQMTGSAPMIDHSNISRGWWPKTGFKPSDSDFQELLKLERINISSCRMNILHQDFYNRDTLSVARTLLGKKLVREYRGNILSGLICDGARPGCPMKTVSGVDAAMRAAFMAIDG